MEKLGWKITAIVFITLFLLETGFIIWSYQLVVKEEKKTFECFYDICEDNIDAMYEDKVCTCYDLDVMGEYVIDKKTYMG